MYRPSQTPRPTVSSERIAPSASKDRADGPPATAETSRSNAGTFLRRHAKDSRQVPETAAGRVRYGHSPRKTAGNQPDRPGRSQDGPESVKIDSENRPRPNHRWRVGALLFQKTGGAKTRNGVALSAKTARPP